MHKTTRATLGVLLAATAAGYLTQRTTMAYPAYKDKEGVGCNYCHVKPGGPRNYRGMYYKRNSLSFENFDDYAAAISRSQPVAQMADAKPKSLTTPTPLTDAHNKLEVAKKAYEAKPDDAALKTAYVMSLTDVAKMVMDAKKIPAKPRFAAIQVLAKDALALDADNAAAKDALKAAEDGMKMEEEKMKAKDGAAPAPATP